MVFWGKTLLINYILYIFLVDGKDLGITLSIARPTDHVVKEFSHEFTTTTTKFNNKIVIRK